MIFGEPSDVSQTKATKNQIEFDGVYCYNLVSHMFLILLCDNNVDKILVEPYTLPEILILTRCSS